MKTNTASDALAIDDQADTAGFGIIAPGQPAIIAVLIGQMGLPPAAPQSLTCRKAGKDQQEYFGTPR